MAMCALCSDEYQPYSRLAGYDLCQRCWSKDILREYDRLASARRQAERAGLPATLTLREWLAIITDWRGLCAYCQVSFYAAIDVCRPADGLTATNAVPICKACSVHKNGSFAAAMERVQAYLSTAPKARMQESHH